MAMPHAQPNLDLGNAVVMDALWGSLGPDERRAMRACCKPMRDAVDAQVGSLECPKQQAPMNKDSPVLSAAACARLCGVRTMTLRSMHAMRAMLLQAGAFPRLQSLRLLLEVGR
jgi:hypothetical protein